jgi:diguanylate cyclase (GGDEF)-like protein
MIVSLTKPSIARAAILPVAGMLSATTILGVVALAHHNRAGTTANLLEKAALTARVMAPNAAAAAWNFDTQSGARLLQSLESDPDFASGIIVDDKGEVFASSRSPSAMGPSVSPQTAAELLGAADPRDLKIPALHEFVRRNEVIDILPLLTAQRGTRNVGYMVLSFSRARADAAAFREILAIGTGGIVVLLAVSALLAWILSRVTHPIRDITDAMGRLSAGAFDTGIPALDRRDEIGAMARALAVFKENSIERQRLEFLTRSLQDKTDELQREGEKVAHLAHHDTLTGLANRAELHKRIDQSRANLECNGVPFAVFVLDLDRFKEVNDSLGHAAGDALLRAVAQRLTDALRQDDVLARLGGDEFAIIQSAPRASGDGPPALDHHRQGAIELATRILQILAEPFALEGDTVFIGCSIGISLAPEDASEPEALMKAADLALYEAKAAGRNCFFFFDATMTQAIDERHRLEADMRAGLTRGEFELVYQPIIDLRIDRAVGAEALVRWRHPLHGLMTPDRFIPIAEDTGLIVELGAWVLQQACRDAMAWPDDVRLAVNLSASQFRDARLLDVIRAALVDVGLPPSRLEVEVTETVLLEKHSGCVAALHHVRDLGVSVALDDFGTGYSSLSYLRTFPFDKIKIDRSFTQDITERADCAAIVSSILGLGRSLAVATTVEGIETDQQLEMVRAAGATLVQGFLFGKPVPAPALDLGRLGAACTVEAAA